MTRDVLAVVDQARPHLLRAGPETETWLDRLDALHDELHDLVDAKLAAEPAAGADLCAGLWPYWWMRGHMAEGREFLERAAALDDVDRESVLKGLGTIAFRQGDLETAESAFTRRYELVDAAGSRAALVVACTDLARVALRRGDFTQVRAWADRGYEAAEGLDDPGANRLPLHLRAAAARMEGRYDEARNLYLESIDLNAQLGNEVMVAAENHNLIYVELHSGDREEAERRFRSSSEWIFAHDNAYLRPYSFLDAGVLALHDGDLERACRLVACAQRIFEETDSIPDPDDYVELENAVAELKDLLGSRFDDVWDEGRRLGVEEAVVLARDRIERGR